MWRYAGFAFTNSAFLTGLLDTAYTLAFAIASYWLTIRRAPLSGRTVIVASGLISAAVIMVMALLTPLHAYLWLLLPTVVVGVVLGVIYPAWYSQLRRGRDSNELYRQLGPYEAVRVVAILIGTAGIGLVAHVLGLEPATLMIAAVFAVGGSVALTFPRSDPDDIPAPQQTETPPRPADREIDHRVRLLFGLLAALQLMLAPIVAVTPVLAVEGIDGGVAHVGLLFDLYSAGGVLQFVTTRAAAHGIGVRVLVSAPLALMLGSATAASVLDDMVSAAFLMVSFGFGVASIGTLINAEIQSSVHESERDQHVATFALILSVAFAVGSGLWGLAADFLPVPTIAIITTVSTAVIAALLLVSWRRVSGRWSKSGDPGRCTREAGGIVSAATYRLKRTVFGWHGGRKLTTATFVG
ncbi:hypothetical protein LAUMK22_05251 [Mycobacterium kansasii]|nr:hypothetical protein MKANGN_52090 [Mycobacterium kansasii]VAZ63413.1 hypothetical protein LAUMK22_05251 [Mycobacterium kansasii]VAZ64173.1 hypothetical protein LAUMK40_00287 [Mycobacterium kansasii]VTO99959.1 Major Facilitator Superfamily protein [Mycobacterium kansasii]